jgi:hypothetical protein
MWGGGAGVAYLIHNLGTSGLKCHPHALAALFPFKELVVPIEWKVTKW